MKKIKLEYAGHVRESSGELQPSILEGKVCGKRGRGRPRQNWMDDNRDWTGLETYEKIKNSRRQSKMKNHNSQPF